MKVVDLRVIGDWSDVKECARNTIGLAGAGVEPTDDWKRKMIFCEHSPIRRIKFVWKWVDLPYWVSVHFCRHKIGCEHWVSTQRDDRNNKETSRNDAPQGSLVTHIMESDLQALINISKVRLCTGASPETRQAWKMVIDEIAKVEPEVARTLVPSCVYRGFCPEYISCGYYKTEAFNEAVKKYRGEINL
jgi:hypothetical protein